MKKLLLLVAAAGLVASAAPGSAQDYPNRPIRFVVPFTPGGVTDNVARVMGERMSRELGQSIVVENRPGAGAQIGTEVVAKSSPDGYTLLISSVGLAIRGHLVKLPYDAEKDFEPISLFAINPLMVVANPKLPVRNLPELIEYSKKNPDKLSYGSSGVGGPSHLGTELLNSRTGMKMVHVPYKGDSAAVVDVIAGNVDLSLSSVSATIAYIQSGQLRPIAIASLNRVETLPDVPTVAEVVAPGFSADSWVGLLAPAGTPKETVQKVYKASQVALADPVVREKLVATGNVIIGNTPAEFAAFIKTESQKWGEVICTNNIKIDE